MDSVTEGYCKYRWVKSIKTECLDRILLLPFGNEKIIIKERLGGILKSYHRESA